MLTLTLTPGGWIAILLVIFISGKVLQQGGVQFGRGQDWHMTTLLGAALELGLFLVIGFVLLTQNTTI